MPKWLHIYRKWKGVDKGHFPLKGWPNSGLGVCSIGGVSHFNRSVEWCLLPIIVVTFRFKILACTVFNKLDISRVPDIGLMRFNMHWKDRDWGTTFMKTPKSNSTHIHLQIGTQVDHHESVQWRVLSLCFGAQNMFPSMLVGCVSWGGNMFFHGWAVGCRVS